MERNESSKDLAADKTFDYLIVTINKTPTYFDKNKCSLTDRSIIDNDDLV